MTSKKSKKITVQTVDEWAGESVLTVIFEFLLTE